MYKQELYESIMRNVAKEVKKTLNEALYVEEKDLRFAANFLLTYLNKNRENLLNDFVEDFEGDKRNIKVKALNKILDDAMLFIEKENNLL